MISDKDRSHQRAAAAMARQFRKGNTSFEASMDEFGESRDPLVAELVDLVEHEPQKGGLLVRGNGVCP